MHSTMSGHFFLLTTEGLFCWGRNYYGQLGLGHTVNQSTPQKTLFDPNAIISIACGRNHSLILCRDGLYVFGFNEYGQLGLGNLIDQNTPQKTNFSSDEVISVYCGFYHSFVLCNDGLYAFGDNGYGQLGLGHIINQSTPQKAEIFKPDSVLTIACGGQHSLVLCKNGLYSFGYNDSGQLGLGHNANQSIPQKVQFAPDDIHSIACGGQHSLVLCKDGLFVFGNNDFGQLGLGHTIKQKSPQKSNLLPQKTITISCGWVHSLVLCEDGLYSFGNNEYGQLGLGHNIAQNTPQKVQLHTETKNVISIACGVHHSLVLCKDGLFSFGYNCFGQLGLGHNINQPLPQKIFISGTIIIDNLKEREREPRHKVDMRKKINSFMKDLLNSGECSDITIKNLKLHKAIITAKYPILLQSITQEKLLTLSEEAFKQLFTWIYTNNFDPYPPDAKIILEILNFSSQNGLKNIVDMCSQLMVSLLNKQNIFEILILSLSYSLKQISEWIIWFIASKKISIPEEYYDKLPLNVIDQIIESKTMTIPPPHGLNIIGNDFKICNWKVFKKLLNDNNFADKLIVNGKDTIYYHKFIIFPKWNYFKDVDKSYFHSDIPLTALKTIFKYFYIGLNKLSLADACWISSWAEIYHLKNEKDLILMCQETINSNLETKWDEIISIALQLPNEELLSNATRYIPADITQTQLATFFSELFKNQQYHNKTQKEILMNHINTITQQHTSLIDNLEIKYTKQLLELEKKLEAKCQQHRANSNQQYEALAIKYQKLAEQNEKMEKQLNMLQQLVTKKQ